MQTGPFERHLRDAIELNRQRAPLYAAASGGASLPISRALLRRERLLLPLARWLDRRGERWRRAGVPVLDDLFVPMRGAAPFAATVPAEPPWDAPPAPRAIRRRLRDAQRRGGLAGAAEALEEELAGLAAHPAYACLLRHLLESALRVCAMAPRHAAAARERGLPSPEWMHRLLFRLHRAGLADAARLDARAYPLQLRGIPILRRDLPPIPPHP